MGSVKHLVYGEIFTTTEEAKLHTVSPVNDEVFPVTLLRTGPYELIEVAALNPFT